MSARAAAMSFARAPGLLRRLQPLIAPAIISVAAVAIWRLFFVGFIASDDGNYFAAAHGWLDHFPYVGVWWWDLRHTLTLPMALSMRLFGESEVTLALPDLAYFIGIVLTAFYLVRREAGTLAAAIATSILLTIAVLALAASTANVDLPEAFFVLLSVALFLAARHRDAHATPLLLGAGAAAGLALLSRETTIALLIFYFIAYVAGFGIARRRYWIMAIGFLAIAALDPLYFAIVAHDPLHRLHVALAGIGVNDRDHSVRFGIDNAGALRIHPLIDPILYLFTRPDFGIVFYLFVPAALWAALRRRGAAPAVVTARMLALLAIVSVIFNAIVLRHNQILARYDTVAVTAAAITVAIWLVHRCLPRQPRLTAALLVAAIAINLVGIGTINRDPRWSERALVTYLASDRAAAVVTDPETVYRARLFLAWAGDTERVTARVPQPGDLYFYAQHNSAKATAQLPAADLPLYRPRADWTIAWQEQAGRSAIGALLERLRLPSLLPAPLAAVLDRPPLSVTVYQVGSAMH